MLDEVRKQARLSRRTLWGSVASGVSYAMSRGFVAPPATVLDTTYRVLAALGADDLVELTVAGAGRPGHQAAHLLPGVHAAHPEGLHRLLHPAVGPPDIISGVAG